jgi:hypothetical protein
VPGNGGADEYEPIAQKTPHVLGIAVVVDKPPEVRQKSPEALSPLLAALFTFLIPLDPAYAFRVLFGVLRGENGPAAIQAEPG